MRTCLWFFFFCPPWSLHAATVELPAEVPGEPASFLRVAAKTDCAELRWLPLDPGLNLFPTDLLKDSRTAVVVALKPGRYRLLAYGAKDNQASQPAICVIVIGNPPEPPTPTPPTPAPEDELLRDLRAAYRNDRSPDKEAAIRSLAKLYREVTEKELRDIELKTVGELFQRMSESRRKNIPDASLLEVRRVLEKELNRQLPINPSTNLDTPLRIKMIQLFQQIATRLESLS